jgi:hypothetical protein
MLFDERLGILVSECSDCTFPQKCLSRPDWLTREVTDRGPKQLHLKLDKQ